MIAAVISMLVLSSAPQSVGGVKAIPDGARNYAQALVAWSKDDESVLSKPDTFLASFFMSKAKSMAPLYHTKYTAAQMGLCGIVLGIYDTDLGASVKSPADRITNGKDDYGDLTDAEKERISKAMVATPLMIIGKRDTTKADIWKFFSATSLGMLNARVTMWYLSPKQETLLKWIAEDVKGCAEKGGEADGSAMPEVATALKGFSKFVGKKLDEATMKEIGAQVDATLKAAVPAKYRW